MFDKALGQRSKWDEFIANELKTLDTRKEKVSGLRYGGKSKKSAKRGNFMRKYSTRENERIPTQSTKQR